MQRSVKRVTFLAAALAVAAIVASNRTTVAQMAPSTQPAADPDQAKMDAIMAEVQTAGQELQTLLVSPKVFTDPTKRAEAAPRTIPVLKKLEAQSVELRALNTPRAKQIGEDMGNEIRFMLVVFGDADAKARLERDAGAPDISAAQRAQAQLLIGRWLAAAGDAAAQTKALEDYATLAKTNPTSDPIAIELMKFSQFADEGDASKRVDEIISSMKAPAAAQWAQVAEQRKQTEAAQAKLHAMENKPLAIAGTTTDGKPFTTADWKGKVILVDFWATWCGPCIAELPRVKRVYKDYHDKGFEIIGVSCDRDANALKQFVAKDEEMKWPQLFDEQNPKLGWHPIASGFGINAIPTMFLIDKEGNLRSTDARENFEEMIPKLLAENAK